MKILIVSDTHRKNESLKKVLEMNQPIDRLIHLGDSEGSEHLIESWVGDTCELSMIMGNNDFFSSLEQEIELEIGPHKVMLTHGHHYNVSLGVENLRREAIERGCDIAMYGHTHRPYLEEGESVTILNPGSLSYPRQEGRKPSYMIMEMQEDGTLHYHTYYLDR